MVVLADLAGDDRYHVGDEAMAEATIAWLRTLPADDALEIVVASSDPDTSAARLGCSAVPWAGFAGCTDASQRQALAAALVRPDATPNPLVSAVAGADALIVAGGGNLNSMWPEHVHERALAVAVARRAGIPVVVTGQTLGPFDTAEDREAAATVVGTATVVGVREPHSAREAQALGVESGRLVLAPDDALLLEPECPEALPPGFEATIPPPSSPSPGAPQRTIAVTLHPFAPPGHPHYAALGQQLAEVADRVGARILLVPHVRMAEGEGDMSDGDVAVELAAHCDGTILESPTARQAVWASHTAWMVVSSRYHPIVFASAAAVPALALIHGHYTSVKCRGALGQVGTDDWWVDLEAAAGGALAKAAGELARRRTEVADWIAEHLDELAARDAWRRWRIATVLGYPMGPAPAITRAVTHPRVDTPRPAGGWAARRT